MSFGRPRQAAQVDLTTIMRFEERVGPEGRKLFEKFLAEVNQLQERQDNAVLVNNDDDANG
jgi:hypothetical protein